MKESTRTVGKRLLTRAACWFTGLSLSLLIPALILGDNDLTVVHPLRMLLLLPMALCFAGAGLVRLSDLKGAVRAVLHAALTVSGFYVCGYLPFMLENKSGALSAILILLFVLLLWVIGFVVSLFIGDRRRRKQTDTDKPRRH